MLVLSAAFAKPRIYRAERGRLCGRFGEGQLLDLCRLAKGGNRMSEIRVKDNESRDNALKRFKRSCAKSGVLAEVRKREHYEKPSVRRKKKSEAARKRKFK